MLMQTKTELLIPVSIYLLFNLVVNIPLVDNSLKVKIYSKGLLNIGGKNFVSVYCGNSNGTYLWTVMCAS